MTDTVVAQELIDLAAAVFVARFGLSGGLRAWQRAHQSFGWEDDPEIYAEWEAQVARGRAAARQLGLGLP